MTPASFVIVRIATGEPIAEIFDTKLLNCLDYQNVRVVPIMEWLQSLNEGTGK